MQIGANGRVGREKYIYDMKILKCKYSKCGKLHIVKQCSYATYEAVLAR